MLAMPPVMARALVKWVGLVWVASLLLGAGIAAPAVWLIHSGVTDAARAAAVNDAQAVIADTSGLWLTADACRASLMLPAPLTLRFVPGTADYLRSLEAGCREVRELAGTAPESSAATLAEQLADLPAPFAPAVPVAG